MSSVQCSSNRVLKKCVCVTVALMMAAPPRDVSIHMGDRGPLLEDQVQCTLSP